LKWPNFFIVGAQNSATTTLYGCLREHPQVFMPAMKEPHYFSNLRAATRMRYPVSHVSDRWSYLRLFSSARNQIAVGEASSSYLWEATSAARIHEANPGAAIIIVLRDPVARAYSHYLMDLREGWANLPFYNAVRQDWENLEKGYGISRLYVELGLYSNQVKTYLNAFGPKAVHIVLFEEFTESLRRGNMAVLSGIYNFLGIDCDHPRFDTLQSKKHIENGYSKAKFHWASRIAGSRIVRRIGEAVVPRRLGSTFVLKKRLYEPLFLKDAYKPPMDAAAKRWLCRLFDDDLNALERLLRRKLIELRRTW
jgi:hypothetical protein